MKKGSITIFLALVLVLIMSFVFSMLEGARVHCLQGRAEMVSKVCMQSVFGNYHVGLWEDYHLLLLDGSWEDGEFSVEKLAQKAMEEAGENLDCSSDRGSRSWQLTNMTARDMAISRYELATDHAGQAFLQQVSRQMELEAGAKAIEELLSLQNQGSNLQEQKEQKDSKWEQACDAIDQAQEQKEEQSDEETMDAGQQEMENPMDYVRELKEASVLGLVLENPSELSSKAVENRSSLEDRQLNSGNWQKTDVTGVTDRLWLQYYIQTFFSNYVRDAAQGSETRQLAYEMEYILGGKSEDSENLEVVVMELLGVREVMNFTTILQDAGKKAMALNIATAAVGFTGLLPLIKAVQIGVLLAWAFVESVLDVRALLAGESVPLMKSTSEWSSDLTNCRASIEDGKSVENVRSEGTGGNKENGGNKESGDDGKGLDYTQYLQLLLFLLSEKTISYRCMDLIEYNEQVCMDHMVQAAEGTFFYEAKPLFWSFNMLTADGWEGFELSASGSFRYVKEVSCGAS